MPRARNARIFRIVGSPYRIRETDESVEKLKTGNEGPVLMVWGIWWRRIWKWAIFLMLRGKGRPVTGIPRVLEHAPVVMIAIVELVEYWVASLKVLAGPLYR